MTTTKTECPVCGPATTSFVGECHQQPVVSCDDCGLMFVGECQTVADTEEFFRTEHVDREELTAMHYVTFRRDSLEREAGVIQRLLPEGGRLLDVGTASGYFLREFADKPGWEPVGVEPSAVSTRFARAEFGLDVREGYLIEQQFDAASFDVVTSLDAFNCHRSPNEDLAEIHRLLKPGGIFAIEIPGQSYRMLTGSGLLCRLLFGCSLRLNAGVNFYFYTTQSLVTMARRAGFQLQDSYPESTPVQGRWVARMAKTAWFRATSLLYRATAGRVHYAPKEYLIFRKPVAPAGTTTASRPAPAATASPAALRRAA